jgi:hypothetical protein
MPELTTKIAITKTPSANSGIDAQSEAKSENRPIGEAALAHSGNHAQHDGERHDDREADGGQQQRVGQAVPQHVGDRPLVEVGFPEVAAQRVRHVFRIPLEQRAIQPSFLYRISTWSCVA